jgi:1,4-dihydroxy-2-naphthoyl-CoA hydrolase
MDSIWYKPYTLEQIKDRGRENILEHLGIVITGIENAALTGSMPVDQRTIQPAGILHGGASVVLAETLGSLGASLTLNPELEYAVGLEVNATHLRPVSEGLVFGKAILLHRGRSIQLWSIEIRNEQDKLTCVSRLTMAIKKKE